MVASDGSLAAPASRPCPSSIFFTDAVLNLLERMAHHSIEQQRPSLAFSQRGRLHVDAKAQAAI